MGQDVLQVFPHFIGKAQGVDNFFCHDYLVFRSKTNNNKCLGGALWQ